MSTRTYCVSDKGIVVKMEELNYDEFFAFFKVADEYKNTKEENKPILTYELLIEDCQVMLGKQWTDGVICHKENYGNDIQGDFIPLIEDAAEACGVSVEQDEWVFMCLPKYPSLFKAAYKNKEQVIEKMKKLYSRFIRIKDFNYEARLVSLCGTVWG